MPEHTEAYKRNMSNVKHAARHLNKLGSVDITKADKVELYCNALESLSRAIKNARAAYEFEVKS